MIDGREQGQRATMNPDSQDIPMPEVAAALSGWPLDPLLLLTLVTLVGVYLAIAVLLVRLSFRRGDLMVSSWPVLRPAYVIARHAHWTVLTVFVIALLCGLVNGLIRYPLPAVNDEFGYLLTADTFAQGRLANPTHPLWRHFETTGVYHEPVYVAKYPPAAAAFMAVGQVVFGHPWWGQLLAYALAAAATAWMLRAFVGPRWALVGGVMLALHPNLQRFQVYDYGWTNYSWSHSYWGGAVAMLGGALVFGGLRHFLRRPRVGYGIAAGLGAGLLLNSRPLEAVLVSLPFVIALLIRLVRRPPERVRTLLRFALPAALVLVPVIALMLVDNRATTGHPFELAHQHYAKQYGAAAEFLFQTPRTPPESYGNFEMRRFYLDWVRPTFEARSGDLAVYLDSRVRAFDKYFWTFFATSWPALLVLPLLLQRKKWRLVAAPVAISFALLLAVFDFHPHYAAPSFPLAFALMIGGMAQLLRLGGRESALGRGLVVTIVALTTCSRLWAIPPAQEYEVPPVNDWPRMRAFVVEELTRLPGKDLILVTTHADHFMFQNWVHNGADLENDEVLFARDLELPLEHNPIVDYYEDRHLWHLELTAEAWKFGPVDRGEALAGS
ncbi:MAG: hypothetical protein R3F35_20970 [Myxococcota bacterium]